MSALDQAHFAMLEKLLDAEFVPHLPPLLDKTKPPDQQKKKNLSRAFGAYALSKVCGIGADDSAKAVVDDFDDFGIDAIYYRGPSETLYLVQSKLKAAEQFSQDEALAFGQGIRKLLEQDFTGFNANVQNRKAEIEDALDNCSHIKLVIAHTGSGISKHAEDALDDLFPGDDDGDVRLERPVIDYDARQVTEDLVAAKAYEKVNVDLWLSKCTSVTEPRVTYFGLAQLIDLVALHKTHGKALYEKNIRTFLGIKKNEVNISIQKSLRTSPQNFVYLNNGVTALCELVEPKGHKGARRKLRIRGLSVVNGAQTIATSAQFVADSAGSDISTAKVSFTLIKSDADTEFGKQVTRARNHQTPVLFSDFAALDDRQETLRRELAYLGIHYAFKPGVLDTAASANHIRIDDAAQALAMFQIDPRYIVWLKKEPAQLLDMNSVQYKDLFAQTVTPFQVANSVRFLRYVVKRMTAEAAHAEGLERLAYKHGTYVAAWILAKRVRDAAIAPVLIDEKKLEAQLSAPFDQLRQTHWNLTRAVGKGPLALFRNQTDVTPLVEKIAIEHYALGADPVVGHKQKQHKPGQPYPEDLFAYLAAKAPQIGNLS